VGSTQFKAGWRIGQGALMTRPVFTWIESPGTSLNLNPSVDVVQYGDGYEGRFARGIKGAKEVWDVVFNNADALIAEQIKAFLKDGLGSKTFDWVPPDQTVARVFKCSSYSSTIGADIGDRNIRARFEEVFEV
jgi:phage-related protein